MNILLTLLLSLSACLAKDSYTLVAVGDIMLGRNYPSQMLPEKDGTLVLQDADSIVKAATVAVGNLEGVLLDAGGQAKTCKDASSCHVFRMPERYAVLLAKAGFDLMGIANNHSGDFGHIGRSRTMEVLGQAGIAYAGLDGDCRATVVERDGIRYGYAAFSISSGTMLATDYKRASALVEGLSSQVDIMVVSMHVGAEGAKYSHITRATETFLGENRGDPYKFARTVIDAGADIVIGHGPHVPRAIDLYKGRFIAYSLGNFATSSGVSISGKSGYAPLVEVHTGKDGKFLGGKIHSFVQSGPDGNRRPRKDNSLACVKEIKALTSQDRLGAGLFIAEDGGINLVGGI